VLQHALKALNQNKSRDGADNTQTIAALFYTMRSDARPADADDVSVFPLPDAELALRRAVSHARNNLPAAPLVP
jgi:hypothetical protein